MLTRPNPRIPPSKQTPGSPRFISDLTPMHKHFNRCYAQHNNRLPNARASPFAVVCIFTGPFVILLSRCFICGLLYGTPATHRPQPFVCCACFKHPDATELHSCRKRGRLRGLIDSQRARRDPARECLHLSRVPLHSLAVRHPLLSPALLHARQEATAPLCGGIPPRCHHEAPSRYLAFRLHAFVGVGVFV